MNISRFFLLLLAAIVLPVLTFSFESNAAQTTELRLASRSLPLDVQEHRGLQHYLLRLRTDASGWTAQFFTEASTSPLCSIEYQKTGLVIERPDFKRQTSDSPIFIAPGYPVPIDVLPVTFTPGSVSYKFSSTAGGRRFTQQYTVTSSTMDMATALEKGWIKTTVCPQDATLSLLSVYKENNALVCRQLWCPGLSWWLYETTLFRESWYID